MAYVKSAARKDFENIYNTLLEQAVFASKQKQLRADIIQCVYNNAIFRLSAAFEDYIKAIFEDWIDMLEKHDGCLSDLPEESVSYALLKHHENMFLQFLLNGSEGKVINEISTKKILTKKLCLEGSPVKDLIKTNQLVMDKKYPSQKNLKQLFNRFGFKDIFKDMEVKGKKDYKLLLQSFSDSRTELAHSYSSMPMSKQTVKDNINNVYEIVRVIDRVLYSHVCNKSGSRYWKVASLAL